MSILNKILAIFTAIFFVAIQAFRAGKNSQTNKENARAIGNIEKLNKITDEVSSLSESDLDKRLRKWKKPATK